MAPEGLNCEDEGAAEKYLWILCEFISSLTSKLTHPNGKSNYRTQGKEYEICVIRGRLFYLKCCHNATFLAIFKLDFYQHFLFSV